MKLIGYGVLFLVCLFVSILIVGILLTGNGSDLAQGGKAALSFVLALISIAIITREINKISKTRSNE
jgi:hypothetical protein